MRDDRRVGRAADLEHNERIRITAGQSDLTIAVEGGAADLLLDGQATLPALNEHFRLDALDFVPGEQPGTYVFTIEFDPPDPGVSRRNTLRRLDVHVGNVSIRVHDDGYVLEAALIGWVGYAAEPHSSPHL